MKKLFTLTLILFAFFAKADYWTQKADFGGSHRYGAVGFSINGIGYMGTGIDTFSAFPFITKDFWSYDPILNVWTQKADVGLLPRANGVGFSIGNFGYVGLGMRIFGNVIQLNDFWKYDASNNTWIQVDSLPANGRLWASVCIINNKAYVGLGRDDAGNGNIYSDWWEYDTLDVWVQKASFSSGGRYGASSFSISGYGFIGQGRDSTNQLLNDFWKYDPIANSWSTIAFFPGGTNVFANTFSIGSVGYVLPGWEPAGLPKNLWKYTTNNSWVQLDTFPGIMRNQSVTFSIGTKAYLATGQYPLNGSTYPLNDLWEYSPDSTTDIPELNENKFSIIIFPNPITNKLNIAVNTKEISEIILYDVSAKKILQQKFTNSISLNTKQLAKGIYIYEVRNKDGSCKKGKVVKE